MPPKITNMRRKGCAICQNSSVSSIVDPLIFSCQIRIRDLIVNLENRGIFVDEEVLREHVTHVFAVEEDDDFEDVLIINPDATNLEIVKKTLAKIEMIENSMLISGQEDNKAFLDLLKRKQEFLTLKAKLEGEIQDVVVTTVPKWITKIQEDEVQVIDVTPVEALPEKTDLN